RGGRLLDVAGHQRRGRSPDRATVADRRSPFALARRMPARAGDLRSSASAGSETRAEQRNSLAYASGWCALACLVTLLAGCGPKHANMPAHYPVTGKITLDGKPLPGAGIMFLPRGNTRGTGSQAMTDKEGAYTLKSDHAGAGAAEGEYAVTISRVVNRDGTPYVPRPDAAEAGERETLPGHYSDSMKTILSANVPKGGDTINFELTSRRSP